MHRCWFGESYTFQAQSRVKQDRSGDSWDEFPPCQGSVPSPALHMFAHWGRNIPMFPFHFTFPSILLLSSPICQGLGVSAEPLRWLTIAWGPHSQGRSAEKILQGNEMQWVSMSQCIAQWASKIPSEISVIAKHCNACCAVLANLHLGSSHQSSPQKADSIKHRKISRLH